MFHHHIKDAPIDSVTKLIHVSCIVKRLYQERYFEACPVNCHVLARALAHFINARVATGYVLVSDGKGGIITNDHSWIPVRGGWIIDSKPVDIISFGPLLVDTRPGMIGHALYRRDFDSTLKKIVRSKETRKKISELKQKIADISKENPITKEEILGYLGGDY